MSVPAKKQGQERFTYADYLTWPDEERWELIHGVAYDMSSTPPVEHQRVSGRLLVQLDRFFTNLRCEVFVAPFDVRLAERDEHEDEIMTVVQPDISVICNPAQIDNRGCKGAPELIVEILSPGTFKKDITEKLALYEHHQVKEYWIVHPFEHSIQVFRLHEDFTYGKPAIYTGYDMLPVNLFPGLEIDLAAVFGLKRVEAPSEEAVEE